MHRFAPAIASALLLASLAASQGSLTPGPRSQPILLYDDRERRVLLFDGAYPSSPGAQRGFTEVWTWTGKDWRALPGKGSAPRYASAAAFDSRRGRVVSFSGRVGPNEHITRDTWEWDGQEWRQMSDTSAGARDHHAMVFDAARGNSILFGGGLFPRRSGPWATDTWTWDGNQWSRAATHGPTGRAVTSLVYDSRRKQVVLFGGVGAPEGVERKQASFGDTWVWEGTAWRQVSTEGPEARNRHAMAFDTRAGVALLYGGSIGQRQYADMWKWDGERWSPIRLTGATPGLRELHSMVYDAARDRTILYGGNSAGKVLDDTWEWDGARWRRVK